MRLRWVFIGLLLLFAACTTSVKDAESTERTCRALLSIDSVMWQQPDSALTLLLAFVESPEADGLVTILGNNLESAEVYNALGQRVATATGQGEQLTVNLEGLPSGIYFINVTDTEGRRCVKKVVKQ